MNNGGILLSKKIISKEGLKGSAVLKVNRQEQNERWSGTRGVGGSWAPVGRIATLFCLTFTVTVCQFFCQLCQLFCISEIYVVSHDTLYKCHRFFTWLNFKSSTEFFFFLIVKSFFMATIETSQFRWLNVQPSHNIIYKCYFKPMFMDNFDNRQHIMLKKKV